MLRNMENLFPFVSTTIFQCGVHTEMRKTKEIDVITLIGKKRDVIMVLDAIMKTRVMR